MTKTFCDGCGEEITEENHGRHVEWCCHLVEEKSRGYVNRKGDSMSGRMIGYDLCAKCYNRVGWVAIKELRSIQEGTKAPDA